MNVRCFLPLLALVIALPVRTFAEKFVVEGGKAAEKILTPASPSPEIQFAAGELVAHLKQMTGAQLDVAVDPGGALSTRKAAAC